MSETAAGVRFTFPREVKREAEAVSDTGRRSLTSVPLPPPPPPERDGPSRSGASGNLPTPPPSAAGAASCYRHPDRAAGRRCTRCGRPACESCLVQASVGSHCVECTAKAQPDLKTRAKYWQAGKPALVTYVLLTLNVGAFVLLGLYYDLPGMLAGDLTEAHVKFGLSPFFLDGEAKTALDLSLIHI